MSEPEVPLVEAHRGYLYGDDLVPSPPRGAATGTVQDPSTRALTWSVDWASLDGFEDCLADRLAAPPTRH